MGSNDAVASGGQWINDPLPAFWSGHGGGALAGIGGDIPDTTVGWCTARQPRGWCTSLETISTRPTGSDAPAAGSSAKSRGSGGRWSRKRFPSMRTAEVDARGYRSSGMTVNVVGSLATGVLAHRAATRDTRSRVARDYLGVAGTRAAGVQVGDHHWALFVCYG